METISPIPKTEVEKPLVENVPTQELPSSDVIEPHITPSEESPLPQPDLSISESTELEPESIPDEALTKESNQFNPEALAVMATATEKTGNPDSLHDLARARMELAK